MTSGELAGTLAQCDTWQNKRSSHCVEARRLTISHGRALVDATINGTPARFEVNTGAVVSFTSPAIASQYKLPLRPTRFSMRGFGGSTTSLATTVQHFALTGFAPFPLDLLVAGTILTGDAANLIGAQPDSTNPSCANLP